MLKITYDPQDGIVVSDGKIDSWIEGHIRSSLNYEIKHWNIGSELMIHAIRVAIKQGKLDHDNVVFVFDGEEIKVDKDGRIADWSIGFCDHFDKYLVILLEWDK